MKRYMNFLFIFIILYSSCFVKTYKHNFSSYKNDYIKQIISTF